MPTIKHSQPRFAGYRVTNGKDAQLNLPGQMNLDPEQIQAEVMLPGAKKPTTLSMEKAPTGDRWVSSQNVPLGTDYRFRVKPKTDLKIRVALKDQPALGEYILTQKYGPQGVWEINIDKPVEADSHLVFQIPHRDDIPKPRAEKIVPGQDPRVLPLRREGENWVFADPNTTPGTTYRLSPGLDALEVVNHDSFGSFNRVSPHEPNAPQKSTVMADVILDSLTATQRQTALEQAERAKKGLPPLSEAEAAQPRLPLRPVRNHFNQFAVDKTDPTAFPEAGLNEMLPKLQATGFSSILLKPFIGGDNLSSHRYWTVDPYILNNSFRDKASFRASLKQMLNHNMKLYADGAFVNQGLDGVQITSNLVHGLSSPYWRWLKAGDENTPGRPTTYPGLAHKKYTFGILPTKINPTTKLPELAKGAFAVRIINDPSNKAIEYDKKRPTFIELYDPRLEKPDGQPITENLPPITASTDSVQKYRFPVDAQEVIDKASKNELKDHGLLEWKRFRLTVPSSDDSGVKWDGQVNTAMLNTRNPEALDYLKGAVDYWSRLVMNTHVGNVTDALMQARQNTPTANISQWLEAITQPVASEGAASAAASGKILPPAVGDYEKLTPEELNHVFDSVAPDHPRGASGKAFAKCVLEEVPMSVLSLPTLFKASLCYPGLSAALSPAKPGGFAHFMNNVVLGTLSRIPLLGHFFQAIRNFIFPKSFQTALGEKMSHIFEQLAPEHQEKLRHGQIQSLIADRVGETVYLSLLTGLTPNEVKNIQADAAHPHRLEDAFYKGMPQDLLQADPVVAAELLPRLLNQRLKTLSSHQLGNLIETELKTLDPQLAAVADAVLQKREMGLNWRIDAARDVGDMSRVFETPAHRTAEVFQQEMNFVQKFWAKLVPAMRGPANKTSIIAELTDFELLAKGNRPLANSAIKQFFDSNTFTGTPNMSYLYSPISQLIHYAQRPDEFGGSQIGPGEFLENMQRSSEAVSFPALRDAQNLTSSHDYPTSSHVMLINPDLFNMDRLKWWGLKDDLTVSINELKSKACFEQTRTDLQTKLGLDSAAMHGVLFNLTKVLEDPKTADLLKDKNLKDFYSKDSKQKNPATNTGTPCELKGQFVQKLLGTPGQPGVLKPADLNLQTPDQMIALQAALAKRISEPSETKAMRGVIVNAVLENNLSHSQKQALWAGLDQAAEKWGSQFGYQPLDIVLNHIFEQINLTPQQWDGKTPEQIKLALYTSANRPVMDKMKRLFAVQASLPGNPSVYLQDLLADGGSEWTKNVQLQNRNLLRVDKLQHATGVGVLGPPNEFHNYFDEVGKIFRARTSPAMRQQYPQLEALNDGVLLPVTPNEQSGILPIVRDNGQHQVITLVNVGAPSPLDDVNKTGITDKDGRYPTPQRIHNAIANYQPDLSELGLKDGTPYEDIYTHEEFVLHEGRLQLAGQPHAGVPVNGWRMLVKKPRTT